MPPRLSSSTPAMTGLLLVCALLSGCGNSGGLTSGTTTSTTTSTTGTLATGGAANVYALNDVSTTATTSVNNVLEYPAASTGTSTLPTVTLPLSTLEPAGAALDGSGLLYVAGTDDISGISSVSVYPAGSTFGAAPLRSFQTNASYFPISIAVSAAGQAYVLEGQYNQVTGAVLATQVEVFAAGATGGTSPTAVLGGNTTQMIDPQDIAVDSTGNIYVANFQDDNVSQILVFPANSNGSVPPAQTLTFTGEITGIAVDSSANVYAAEVNAAGNASVVEFAGGTGSSQTPVKTISGSATGLNGAATGSVRVDAAGNIWLLQQTTTGSTLFSTTATYVVAWSPSANGNIAPAVAFAPSSLVNPNSAFAVR